MKQIILLVFLSIFFNIELQAQDSEQLSQLKPCPPPLTKKELKKLKSSKKSINIDYLNFEPIEIFVETESQSLQNGKKIGIVKAKMNSFQLFFREITAETLTATANIFIRIRSTDYKIKNCFEEQIKFTLKKDEFGIEKQLDFAKMFELSEGIYRLDFVIRDIENGSVGVQVKIFDVK